MFAHDRSLAPAAQHPCFVASRAHVKTIRKNQTDTGASATQAKEGRVRPLARHPRTVRAGAAEVTIGLATLHEFGPCAFPSPIFLAGVAVVPVGIVRPMAGGDAVPAGAVAVFAFARVP